MIWRLLYRKGNEDILHPWVVDHDVITIIEQAHYGVGSGCYSPKAITCKILNNTYWWPTILKDTYYEYVKRCKECQCHKHLLKENFNTMHPIVAWEPFKNLGIHFMSPIDQTSNFNKYIITTTNYCIKWVEDKWCQKTKGMGKWINDACTSSRTCIET